MREFGAPGHIGNGFTVVSETVEEAVHHPLNALLGLNIGGSTGHHEIISNNYWIIGTHG